MSTYSTTGIPAEHRNILNQSNRMKTGRASRQLLVIGMFVLTFLFGSIAGGLFASNKFAQKIKEQTLNPIGHADGVLHHMIGELGLSEGQVEQIKPLVEKHFEQVRRLRQAVIPQVVQEQRLLGKTSFRSFKQFTKTDLGTTVPMG